MRFLCLVLFCYAVLSVLSRYVIISSERAEGMAGCIALIVLFYVHVNNYSVMSDSSLSSLADVKVSCKSSQHSDSSESRISKVRKKAKIRNRSSTPLDPGHHMEK